MFQLFADLCINSGFARVLISLFTLTLVSSLVALCIVNKLQDVIKGRARILELRWGFQSKKEFYKIELFCFAVIILKNWKN